MSWDRIGYLAWLRANAAAVRDAIGVSSGGGGASERFQVVSSLPYTIASDDTVLHVTAAGTLELPDPSDQTQGRKLVIKAMSTLVLEPAAGEIETPDGGFDQTLSLSAGDSCCLRAVGSQWLIFQS